MRTDRRTLMLGSAAAAAALAMGAPARAQSASGQAGGTVDGSGQVPSAYRYAVGDITVTAATDGVNMLALKEGFVTNADLPDVQAALEAAFLPADTLPIPFTPILVATGSDLVLIDTGFADNGPPTAGFLRANLAAAGVAPEDVTRVVISHFHGDHISGLRNKAGDLVYPNAEILVPEPEWAFWMDDAAMAQAPEGRKGNFELVRRVFADMGDALTRYRWDQEIVSGITAIDAHGHTPGHTAFVIASGDEQMIMISDTTNHPALFVRNPDWSAMFDMDADQARQTRHRILDMAASDRLRVAGYHFPFPATGHIARDGDAYRLVPAQWMPVL